MFTLKVKNAEFTIPKENLKLLAQSKAYDLGLSKYITTTEEAIAFLNNIGIEVYE